MRLIYIPKKNRITPIKYGLLYNWYAATDVRNIANTGWHIPTRTEFETLVTYLGGATVAGGKLKEVSATYWGVPNVGATNESGFNARGAGLRNHDVGNFYNITSETRFLTSTSLLANYCYVNQLLLATAAAAVVGTFKKVGCQIRLIKDDDTLEYYTGNDGKIYRTVKIGTQVWMADNLAETKYRNGDTIPEVTDNSAWAALTTGALCAYNNDWSNV